ncbi:tetratricopeptide repeat protein [Methylomonas sp. SURF-2]|uniref:Tetratricopeptide repeat protein n=1 Tax=Methylomonas subterranea TaxID=2952225 RepID=A0ABT1TIE1_9GAMM|nr:tetratricopeptide repeat protein [Methylomonas sp. SURF-2]MCQ8105237.1 tetratricopeptide repeat protein [Methylomonas sp. SURF-2]
MKNKVLLCLLPLWLLSTGCSTFTEQTPPKPVAKVVKPKSPQAPGANLQKPQPKPYVAKKPVPGSGTATYAIDDGKTDFKVEPSLPAFRAEPLTPPLDPLPEVPSAGAVPAAPALPAFAVEEARVPTGTPPAVLALLTEADRNRVAGNLDAAVVSTERALRIDSRNPTLTYKLAQLRIKQNKPQLAEELAGKAALLAGSDLDLKRKSWLLIAEARRMQQNYQGAKEAKAKSESFFGR